MALSEADRWPQHWHDGLGDLLNFVGGRDRHIGDIHTELVGSFFGAFDLQFRIRFTEE